MRLMTGMRVLQNEELFSGGWYGSARGGQAGKRRGSLVSAQRTFPRHANLVKLPRSQRDIGGPADEAVDQDELADGPAERLHRLRFDVAAIAHQRHMRRETGLHPSA